MTLAFRIPVTAMRDALSALRSIVDEAKLTFSDAGLKSRAVDAANVAMVDVAVDTQAFDRLDPTPDGSTIGVNLETLSEVVGMAESDDDLIAELDPETKKMGLSFPDTGLEYTLALVDPDAIRQEPDIPDLDLGSSFTVPGRAFDRGLSAADLVSDHLRMSGISADALELAADGDTDSVELELSDDDLIDGDLDGDPTESIFSLEYLHDISSPVGGDTPLSISLGDEMPVKLRYLLADGIDIEAMVAPRIQGDR